MSERRNVQGTLLDWSYSDESMSAVEFLEMVRELVESIPPEFRDEARVELEHGWGDEPSKFRIFYDRPETDEEVAERAARDARYREEQEASDRRQYEWLRARFER